MKKLLTLSLLLFFISIEILSGEVKKETFTYAVKDGETLQMDVYKDVTSKKQPCLVLVFGGGFKEGSRDFEGYHSYFQFFAKRGFTVATIDYRLGMKGQKAPSPFNQKPLRKAMGMAVEDLYTATDFLIKHAEKFQIDTTRIIISGSSAGAITVLQADYEKRNRMRSDTILSKQFQYAGVIAYAGAIFSTKGLPKYPIHPAPTLFFHGSKDKLVPYNKTSFFGLGMYGSKQLAKRFRKEKYPYLFYSMEGIGHDVAEYPIEDFQPEILQFIQEYVFEQKPLMVDINYVNPKQESKLTMSPREYYKLSK